MLISVCKMIQRIRERSPWEAPARGRHAWRWEQLQWLPFCCVSSLVVKGAPPPPRVWVFQMSSPCTDHKPPFTFWTYPPHPPAPPHVIIFCTTIFLREFLSKRIELWKKNYTGNHFIHFAGNSRQCHIYFANIGFFFKKCLFKWAKLNIGHKHRI